jgi:TrbC/VIRB2 pilin
MRRRGRLLLLGVLALAVMLAEPAAALAASGNDVGSNLSGLLRGIAGELYTGIVAVVGLLFLFNRRFTELAMFFVAAILVGWLVFAPSDVADLARQIAGQVLP